MSSCLVARALRASTTAHAALAAAIAATLLVGLVPTLASAAGAPAYLSVSAPAHTSVRQPIAIDLRVRSARGLAGYEMAVTWDAGAAHLGGLEQRRRSELGLGGRGTQNLGPSELRGGIAFGQYSCPTAKCVSRKGARHASGVSGTVDLARVSVIPERAGRLEIVLSGIRFVDPAGRILAVSTPVQRIVVRVGAGGALRDADGATWDLSDASATSTRLDRTGDRVISHADAMDVASAWEVARTSGDPCSGRAARDADVNGDGCVDVADVQAVAAAYSGQYLRRTTLSVRGLLNALTPGIPATFVVDTSSDSTDSNAGDGVCATSNNACSLRAAITESNLHSGPDTIEFDIPGGGVQTINLSSALPTISDGQTTIDGYTQSGASANTSALASNAVIRIEVRSSSESVGWGAMTITSPGNVIRGLAMYRNWRSIMLVGPNAAGNAVVGDFIGTNAAGTFATTSWNHANGGIYLNGGAHDNHLGKPNLADRNVVSGNPASGIYHVGEGTRDNLTRNNLVGLSPSGTSRRANVLEGVDYNTGASYNRTGGMGDLERNVLSGNSQNGVEFSHGVTVVGNEVIGNLIGTDVSGNTGPSYAINNNWGVQVEDGVLDTLVSDNVVGNARNGLVHISGYTQGVTRGTIVRNNRIGISLNGTAIPPTGTGCCGVKIDLTTDTSQIGPGNIITNNPIGIGIYESADDKHTITRNSIYGNTNLGIDLQTVGSVTVNDFGDGDSGANQQQNYPALTSATPSLVKGDACAGCTVEVFLADGNGDAYGEGRTFLGDDVAGSNGRFAVSASGINVGDFVTATATDANGNTSEFALNLQVRANPTPAGTAIGTDAFGRTLSNTWGNADFGGYWTVSGQTTDYDMNGSAATILAGSAGITRRASLLSVSQRDVELHVRVQTNKSVQGGTQNIWLTARQQNLNNEYRLRMRLASDGSVYLNASHVIGGTETFLATDLKINGLTHSPGTYIHLRGQVAGVGPVQVKFKAWTGSSEPAGWQFTALDSSTALETAGAIGVGAYLGISATNAPVTFTFDDFDGVAVDAPTPPPVAGFSWSQVVDSLEVEFTDASTGEVDTWSWDFGDGTTGNKRNPNHEYASAGTYSVELTVNGPGGPDSITKQVNVQPPAPPPPTVYAQDDFARTISNGWDSADTGGAWTTSGTAADFAVNSSNGRITTPTPGATRSVYLNSVSRRDIDVTVRVATDKLAVGGNQFLFVIGRRVSDGLEYAAKLRFGTDAKVYLGVSRFDAGETTVVSPSAIAGLTHAPGTFFWVRFQLDGVSPTTVRVKTWADGTSQPAGWQIDTTDGYASLQAAGSVGLRAYVGGSVTNAPVLFRLDGYLVTDPQP